MARLTSDPNDPDVKRGPDDGPTPQSKAYLVLSEEERAQGFIRPLRDSYVHVGPTGPKYPLQDLLEADQERFMGQHYVKFEPYPAEDGPAVGRFWTQQELDQVDQGCQVTTKMNGRELVETYARNPKFYGYTYCIGCSQHLPVAEFVWEGTEERVGS